MDQGLDPGAPGLAMAALRSVNHQPGQYVDGNEHAERLAKIKQPVSRQKKVREGKKENGEVKQEGGISQVRNHLPRQPGAVGVIIGEQSKAGFEAAALFAGL